MKIMIINSSGNVGKSFISRELAYLRCNERKGKILEIETYNNSSMKFFKNDDVIIQAGGTDIEKIVQIIFQEDDLVIDVGASNAINLMSELIKTDPNLILEEIDLFIVPATSDDKIKNDTLKIINGLLSFEINPEKIKVLFNKADSFDDFEDIAKALKNKLGLNVNYDKYNIPLFKQLAKIEKLDILMNDLVNSEKDYKALAKESYKKGDVELGKKYSSLALLKGTAKAMSDVLDVICDNLKKDLK